MNVHLDHLQLALNAVTEEYTDNDFFHNVWGYPSGVKRQQIERSFTAELYHQWRLLIKLNPIEYSNLLLLSNIGIATSERGICFPDLVLKGNKMCDKKYHEHLSKTRIHISGHKYTLQQQYNKNELAIEIKMNAYSQDDTLKLTDAMINTHFKNAVYIIFNKTKTQIKNHAKSDEIFQGDIDYLDNFFFLTKGDNLFSLREALS